MSALRRQLRRCATAWLLFRAASLAALAPGDCCAAHRPPAVERDVDRAGGAEPIPCPMHPAGLAGKKADDDKCTIRGTCDGPLAALFSFLSNHSVVTDSFTLLPDLARHPAALRPHERLTSRLTPPDSPPPRA